jgi:hypothetical protein
MKADRSLRVRSFRSRRYQPDQVTSWRQSSHCRVHPVDRVGRTRLIIDVQYMQRLAVTLHTFDQPLQVTSACASPAPRRTR